MFPSTAGYEASNYYVESNTFYFLEFQDTSLLQIVNQSYFILVIIQDFNVRLRDNDDGIGKQFGLVAQYTSVRQHIFDYYIRVLHSEHLYVLHGAEVGGFDFFHVQVEVLYEHISSFVHQEAGLVQRVDLLVADNRFYENRYILKFVMILLRLQFFVFMYIK
ncbi:Hypothetical_protein [Hexamita inflata]|uniref:Hypothetical_protein n=1 Tax=Hexamita inflata TaxID=28002 RepID=A0AA86QBK6_9EUKA|nr:Hypothetical protein HINF_LOCUS43686 [Hexamita inflata]